MKKYITIITTLCIVFQLSIHAQSEEERKITKGAVLNYDIKDGKSYYKLKATVVEWNPQGNIKVQWQTTAPKAMKGTSTFDYNALNSGSSIRVKLKPGNEVLKNNESRFFSSYTPFEDMFVSYLDPDVTIDGIKKNLKFDDYEYDKSILCNNVSIKLDNAEGYTDGDTAITIDYVEYTYGVILMGYYSAKDFSMELMSIQTPGAKPAAKTVTKEDKIVKDLLTAAAPKGEVKLTKMSATKFVKVRSKYPLLATIEDYDATKGGTIKKPITETYEYRLGSASTPNPPSLVDCLTADLRIIYNQSTNFGIYGLDPVTTKSFPEAAAKKLLDVYINYDFMKIPGYRPWSNWSFVRSLTEEQRIKLAKNLEEYVGEYGFSE